MMLTFIHGDVLQVSPPHTKMYSLQCAGKAKLGNKKVIK